MGLAIAAAGASHASQAAGESEGAHARALVRVGVFGGAFDPPHNAHIALARAALAQLSLTELRIFPTGEAWHKARVLSPSADRLAMARLAFEPLPHCVVDARELARNGPSYTLDTLRELAIEQPGVQLVLILGADQARALPSWHGWHEILKIAIISIADRAHPSGVSGLFDPKGVPGMPPDARFESLAFEPMALSATEIRRRHAAGGDISALVAPEVARYIEQHHLYPTD